MGLRSDRERFTKSEQDDFECDPRESRSDAWAVLLAPHTFTEQERGWLFERGWQQFDHAETLYTSVSEIFERHVFGKYFQKCPSSWDDYADRLNYEKEHKSNTYSMTRRYRFFLTRHGRGIKRDEIIDKPFNGIFNIDEPGKIALAFAYAFNMLTGYPDIEKTQKRGSVDFTPIEDPKSLLKEAFYAYAKAAILQHSSSAYRVDDGPERGVKRAVDAYLLNDQGGVRGKNRTHPFHTADGLWEYDSDRLGISKDELLQVETRADNPVQQLYEIYFFADEPQSGVGASADSFKEYPKKRFRADDETDYRYGWQDKITSSEPTIGYSDLNRITLHRSVIKSVPDILAKSIRSKVPPNEFQELLQNEPSLSGVDTVIEEWINSFNQYVDAKHEILRNNTTSSSASGENVDSQSDSDDQSSSHSAGKSDDGTQTAQRDISHVTLELVEKVTPPEGRVTDINGMTEAEALAMLQLKPPIESVSVVKSQYRERIKDVHPDTGGSEDEFITLQTAKDRLVALYQ